jgi:hypothetical protein
MAVPDFDDEPAFDLICHRCGCALTPGEGSFYVVRIEAVCDPSPPVIDESKPTIRAGEIEALINELSRYSEQELRDQVYRRLTILLCLPCYQAWIENPAGTI